MQNDNFTELWANFRRDVIEARTQGKRNINDTPAHAATDLEVLAEVSALTYDLYEAVTKSTTILEAMNKLVACDAGGRMGYWGDEGRNRSCLKVIPQPMTEADWDKAFAKPVPAGMTEEEHLEQLLTHDAPEPYMKGLTPTMPEDTTADVSSAREDEYIHEAQMQRSDRAPNYPDVFGMMGQIFDPKKK